MCSNSGCTVLSGFISLAYRFGTRRFYYKVALRDIKIQGMLLKTISRVRAAALGLVTGPSYGTFSVTTSSRILSGERFRKALVYEQLMLDR